MQLELSAAERDCLINLLADDLSDKRVEVRRTSTPSFRDRLVAEEQLRETLLAKLRGLQAGT